MDQVVSQARQNMLKVLDVLKGDLLTVRTGRATPTLVDHVVVSVYGGSARMKVMELATIGVVDSQTITITPFDGSITSEIQKGILESNVGLTPVIDGHLIRISIPVLSEERRKELIHLMKQKLENGRVMVRQVRHEAMEQIKKQSNTMSEDEVNRLEKEVQKLTDEFDEQINSMGKHKEQELLQI